MPSIKQNPAGHPLPDFRNFGVMLRILLGVNLLAFAAALVQSAGIIDCVQRYVDMAAWVQPLLLFNLSLLALLGNLLRRLPPWAGQAVVVFLAAASSFLLLDFWSFMAVDDGGWQRLTRAALLGGLCAGAMLFYFALRAKAFSPALAEARLQALTARIRPHFLFNSLTAVLSLIRAEPRRAETALEDLADLFRALMRDHRDLLPLADEIALCRQYLDLEKLRLGERLNVEWEIADVPVDLKVPPLMLQPLLENAVYHGIEPSGDAGKLHIRFARSGDELHIDLSNPCRSSDAALTGNRMALANIRERLALYYDLEARLETSEVTLPGGLHEYRVHIVLPCRSMKS
ncbi:sensor histidine kinase [Propionivibrio sp.]|uniref:sensor histidine kinase n=1 Tax=Propionivibrio sp. TaxID=2212460 RepID=UPI003BF39A37